MKSRAFEALAREAAILCGLVALAAAIRFFHLLRSALCQQDEVIYTQLGILFSRGQWSAYQGFYITYAPPFYPFLVSITDRMLGPSDLNGQITSGVFGALGVVATYLLGRVLFGVGVARGAAFLLALCNFHVIFSRLALTDVTFATLFTFSLWSFWRARLVSSLLWFASAGFLAGIAWVTKYNGFYLLLLFGFATLCLEAKDIVQRKILSLRERWRTWAGLALALATGVIVYLPLYFHIDRTFGYDKLMAHTRGYSRPLRDVVAHLPRTMLQSLDFCWLWAPAVLILGLAGLLLVLRKRSASGLFLWAWFVTFWLALQFYSPFTRLALPLLPVLAIAGGFAINEICGLAKARFQRRGELLSAGFLALAVVAVSAPGLVDTLQARTDGYRQAGVRLAELIQKRNYPIFSNASSVLNYYSPRILPLAKQPEYYGYYTQPGPKFFVSDERSTWNVPFLDFISANLDGRKPLFSIENRRYPPIIFEPANLETLREMQSHPENFFHQLHISIYQIDGPFVIPDSWKQK